jgi:hypothetical protein
MEHSHNFDAVVYGAIEKNVAADGKASQPGRQLLAFAPGFGISGKHFARCANFVKKLIRRPFVVVCDVLPDFEQVLRPPLASE